MQTARFVKMLAFAVGMAFTASCFTALAAIGTHAAAVAPAAVLLGALIAALIMSGVAELAARFPSAIGIRTYVKAAFGERAALFVVLLYLAMILLVAALESSLIAQLLGAAFAGVDGFYVIALMFVALFVLNLAGFELSARVQLLLVAVLALGVAVLVGGAVTTGATARAAALPSVSGFVPAALIAIFLFAGIEWVTVLHLRSPRDAVAIPKVLFAAVACLALLYAGFSYGMLRLPSALDAQSSTTPQLLIASHVYGRFGVYGVVGITLIAVITTFNAGLIGAARILYALAREGRLPAGFAAVTSSGCPWAATALVCAASFVAAFIAYRSNQLVTITEASAAIVATVYAAFLAAAARLRTTPTSRPLSYRSPAPTWLLWLGAGAMGTLVLADVYESLAGGRTLVIIGFVLVLVMMALVRGYRPSAPSYP